MVLLDLRRLLLGILPIIVGTTYLSASGGMILIPMDKEKSLSYSQGTPDFYVNEFPPTPSTNHVFSFFNQGIPTVIVSPSEIAYRLDSLRNRVSDVYLVNKEILPMDDEDDEPDVNARVNLSSNIHFEYDENCRLRKISNREGAFMLFFCEDDEKISKIIYNDGTVLFDIHSVFGNNNYPKEFEQEDKLDCIKLLFAGNKSFIPGYYEIFYYRNAQKQWKFGYRWQSSSFSLSKVAELSKHYF